MKKTVFAFIILGLCLCTDVSATEYKGFVSWKSWPNPLRVFLDQNHDKTVQLNISFEKGNDHLTVSPKGGFYNDRDAIVFMAPDDSSVGWAIYIQGNKHSLKVEPQNVTLAGTFVVNAKLGEKQGISAYSLVSVASSIAEKSGQAGPDGSVAPFNSNYKTNKALSSLLDDQGFKFGISLSEANNLYRFDRKESYHKYFVSGNLGMYQIPNREGFYMASFCKYGGSESKTLTELRKCIGIDSSSANKSEVENKFKIKYGDGFLYHHGRYLVVSLILMDIRRDITLRTYGTAMVLSAIDATDDVVEKYQQDNSKRGGTDRLKNKF